MDRLIKITTALAVVAVAAIISYQHAYELVTSHGETCQVRRGLAVQLQAKSIRPVKMCGSQRLSAETLDCVKQPVPHPQILLAGGTLRFGLGTATGARSNVWTVFGSKNADDVYVGARDALPMAKLSLHQSGKWRRALTAHAAIQQNVPVGQDRVLNRWEVPEPFAEGWVHAVTITIPASSIHTEPEPLKQPKKGTIGFYEIDEGSHQVRFDILIRNVDAPAIRVENIHAEVGRIQLPGGGCVGVYATELTATDGRPEAEIENLRMLSRENIIEKVGIEEFRQLEKPTGAGWGFSHDNGRPTIIDLGDLRERTTGI
jgi:hypothetical protein